jgi:hypothetical protein
MDKVMKKKESINLNKYFSGLIELGLDQELPTDQIGMGKKYLFPILKKYSNKLRLNKRTNLEALTEELVEIAIYIQAFAFNCLKLDPLTGAPINIADRSKFKFKKARLLSQADYVSNQKHSKNAFDFVQKLYYLNESGYDKGHDLLKRISIKLEPKNLINDKKEKIVIAGNQNYKLPPTLHEEFVRDLSVLIEKFTGRIDAYKALQARKNFDSQMVITIFKEAFMPYLRETFYTGKKHRRQFPSNEEALLMAWILVLAGVLPAETEYDKKPPGNGRRRVYRKTANPELGKIDKTTKVNKDYNRPYITYLRKKVTSEPFKRGVFYIDGESHKFLHELA